MQYATIFDTEFTAWEGSHEHHWSRPGEYREIIQIGAIKVSLPDLSVVEEFDVLVRPLRNPLLSGYITGLTGIRQADIDKSAIGFEEALQKFMSFCDKGQLWCYGGDADVMAENMRLCGLSVPEDWWSKEQTNIRPWFCKYALETTEVNSGRLAQTLGLADIKNEHTGLGDCHSILLAMRHIIQNRQATLPYLVSGED